MFNIGLCDLRRRAGGAHQMKHPAAAIWVCGRALENRRVDREKWNDWFEQKKN
jgi:hypothetical protein